MNYDLIQKFKSLLEESWVEEREEFIRSSREKGHDASINDSEMNEEDEEKSSKDSDEGKEARFNGYQSGGRLYKYKDNNLLLTIGDFQNFTPAQDESSFFGKIVSINIDDKKHRLISMGHRNPQGLLYDEKKNIILSTEHGHNGGDEVNLIFDNGLWE